MTCREFMDATESLTPAQLLLMPTDEVARLTHSRECRACGEWLESQLLLGSALVALQQHTAKRKASPRVEHAVLRAFRAQGFGPAPAVAPERAAPAAWRLSRFFEIGAYAAVAAALIVGVFVGSRMWRDRQAVAIRAQASVVAAPAQVDSKTAIAGDSALVASRPAEIARQSGNPARTRGAEATPKQPRRSGDPASLTTVDRQGFVPLMFCDPLICSGDEQIIRMELPADGNSRQPVIADVVVGDDGLVRAMRIVN
jgi:hypothetical protein